MKKIYNYNETTGENNEIYFNLPECFSCSFIARTSGDPITDCDDVDSDFIESIKNLIASNQPEEANEQDIEYIDSLARQWNIR